MEQMTILVTGKKTKIVYETKNKAFTLIEILVVIFLAILLLGIGAIYLNSNSDELILNKSVKEFKRAINYAIANSSKTHKNVKLVFNKNKIFVKSNKKEKLPKWIKSNLNGLNESELNIKKSKKLSKTFSFEKYIKIYMKRHLNKNNKKWFNLHKLGQFEWYISYFSINEPISFRFEIDKSNSSYCELDFGPIGANLIEKRMIIK